jgi:hypothetical protein
MTGGFAGTTVSRANDSGARSTEVVKAACSEVSTLGVAIGGGAAGFHKR